MFIHRLLQDYFAARYTASCGEVNQKASG